MKMNKSQLRRVIAEERAKLLSEQSDNPYLDALESVTESANACMESLDLAARDIGPSDKELYDKMDEAMVMLEDLMLLAEQALENADMESKGQSPGEYRRRSR